MKMGSKTAQHSAAERRNVRQPTKYESPTTLLKLIIFQAVCVCVCIRVRASSTEEEAKKRHYYNLSPPLAAAGGEHTRTDFKLIAGGKVPERKTIT